MQTCITLKTCAGIVLCALLAATASAHPGSGIFVDKDGQVFFTDTGHGVWKIDAKGKLTDVPASRFHWMAIDQAGRFAQSPRSFGEWFERVTANDSKVTLILCSDFPVTVAGDGNLYYADTRPNSERIVRRTPDGKESVIARDAKFQGITGITAGPDDSIYLTETGRPNAVAIRKITKQGTVSTIASNFAGKEHVKDPSADTEAAYCRGLAVDDQGAIFVAVTGSRRVLKITPQGQVSAILESTSPWSPTGVALFGGDVYVLEWSEPAASKLEVREAWLPRVRKIAKDGTVSTLATISR